VTGGRIEYDIKRDMVLAKKEPGGRERVKITIQPRKTD
jgi:hypothetical protein